MRTPGCPTPTYSVDKGVRVIVVLDQRTALATDLRLEPAVLLVLYLGKRCTRQLLGFAQVIHARLGELLGGWRRPLACATPNGQPSTLASHGKGTVSRHATSCHALFLGTKLAFMNAARLVFISSARPASLCFANSATDPRTAAGVLPPPAPTPPPAPARSGLRPPPTVRMGDVTAVGWSTWRAVLRSGEGGACKRPRQPITRARSTAASYNTQNQRVGHAQARKPSNTAWLSRPEASHAYSSARTPTR